MSKRRFAVAACLVVAALAVPAARAAAGGHTTLSGTVPSWAGSRNLAGHEPGTDNVGFRVYLSWHNAAGLDSAIAAVTNPRSASFRQYLSTTQFNAQYAPTQSDVNSVKSWLTAAGFSIDDVPSNNHYVEAEGTAAQVESAFSTTMNLYRVNGLVVRSPAADPQIPASLAGTVSAIAGLDESSAFVHTDIANDPKAAPPAAADQPGPCSTYFGDQTTTAYPNPYQPGKPIPYVVCGYTAAQLEGAYGVAPLEQSTRSNGTGVHVAIIDAYASPTIVQDVNAYSDANGLPHPTIHQWVSPGTFHHPESGGKNKQDPAGWYGEETLDLEAVHAMAPGATIDFVGAPNNFQDLDAAANFVVSRHLASIVTNSYGFAGELLPPGFINAYHSTLQEAALTGIAFYFSSGDCGDEGPSTVTYCGGGGTVSPDWPAVDPDVTAVGGTSAEITSGNVDSVENGWGTHRTVWSGSAWSPAAPGPFYYGSGGGVSSVWAQPAYQSGTVPGSHRAIPDVAMDADPQTGMQIYETQTNPDGTVSISPYRIGGTSLASPLFAGVMALRDEHLGSAAGFSNAVFYAHAGAFHDVLPGTQYVLRNIPDGSGGLLATLRVTDEDTSLPTTTGWDLDTGLGSATAQVVALP